MHIFVPNTDAASIAAAVTPTMYRRFINKSKFKYITDHSGGTAAGTLSVSTAAAAWPASFQGVNW